MTDPRTIHRHCVTGAPNAGAFNWRPGRWACFILLLATFPTEMLVALTLGYLCSIPFGVSHYRANLRRDTQAPPVA